MSLQGDGRMCVRATALLLAVVLCGWGCNALPTRLRAPGPCGVSLILWARAPQEAKYEYFQVEGGTFSYGGGKNALALTATWEVALSPEQCTALCEIARTGGWTAAELPAPVPESTLSIVDVAVRWDGGQRQFSASAEDPAIRDALALLGGIAAGRFQRELDRLPQAGSQRK